MNDKRIETNNADQFVPKKPKTVEIKSQAPIDPGEASTAVKPSKAPRTRRASATQKPRRTSATKSATETPQIATSPDAGAMPTEPSHDAIRLRAYFISERRRRFALPGDAESDWLEAKRQLHFEAGRR
jgi:hypothetical protein